MNFESAVIIAGLMVAALLLLMAMFAQLYRKAGPHEALVVYGFRGTRIIKGRGSVIPAHGGELPIYCRWSLCPSTSPRNRTFTPSWGVAVTVEAVAQIKVKSDPGVHPTPRLSQFLTKTPSGARRA